MRALIIRVIAVVLSASPLAGQASPDPHAPLAAKHEDEACYSVDRARKRIVLWQFHVENFVITSVQDLDAKPGTIAFTRSD